MLEVGNIRTTLEAPVTGPSVQDRPGDGSAVLTADPPQWRDVAAVGVLVAATAATTIGLTLVILGGVNPVTGVAFLLLAATIIVVANLTMRCLRPVATPFVRSSVRLRRVAHSVGPAWETIL